MWGEVAAGAAGLIGSTIGAITSYKESKANRREARRQFNVQMDESVQRRVQDALKAGINPLAALGYNGGASPTIHAGGTSGTGEYISQGFNALGRGLQAAFADKQADDMEFDTQSKELDLESQRLRNRLLRMEIQAKTNTPGIDMEPPPSMEGEQALFIPVYDLQGRPRLTVNQNALEADADNPGYMSSMISAFTSGMKSGQISPFTGEILSPQLRMMLDDQYYQMTGHHIKNLESLYISPAEAAMASTMLWRGIS